MKLPRIASLAFALALALGTTACSEQVQQAADQARQSIAQATAEVGAATTAIEEARRKLREANLRLGSEGQMPLAEITPQGDLLINRVALPMNEAQRAASLHYREQLLAVADAGMNMGQDGIALAGQAVSMAVAGLIGGDASTAIARIEAEAKNMETTALALCEQAKGLKAAQDSLAALMPEFAPYAKAIDVAGICKGDASAEPTQGQ